jgi:hypothetical protein
MESAASRSDRDTPRTLSAIRRMLLATLVVATTGMAVELIFLGHAEGFWQLAPIVLLGLGVPALLGLAWFPHPRVIRSVRVLMMLFVASGLLGAVLHYRGNQAFELEMYPTRQGFELVRETLAGATPVLAPGSMSLIGVVGLIMTFRYPSAPSAQADLEEVAS